MTLQSNDGGSPSRNIYTGTIWGGEQARVIWSSGSWRLQFYDFWIEQWMDLYTSNFASAPNPPHHLVGSWADVIGCGGSSFFTFSGTGTQSALPIELTHFEGKATDALVVLNWQTASETNNAKFEIEISKDGRDFSKAGEVAGAGTSIEAKSYSFDVKYPEQGLSYYRLRQVDYDGQFQYSPVIGVSFTHNRQEAGSFYPSPSKSGLVNLDYLANADGSIRISAFDPAGRLVVQQELAVAGGDNRLSFDFSSLQAGIYFIKIGDELEPMYRKLIIDK